MSIFSSILDKLFHHAQASSGQAGTAASSQPPGQQSGGLPSGQQATSAPGTDAGRRQASGAAAGAATTLKGVDVEAVLVQLASKKGGGGNWRTSVVDLLKLLDLDSSLNGRKELANELNIHVGADGSAEQNIALHKAVMSKVAENGGKVPDHLRH